jgi:hypothetical protein
LEESPLQVALLIVSCVTEIESFFKRSHNVIAALDMQETLAITLRRNWYEKLPNHPIKILMSASRAECHNRPNERGDQGRLTSASILIDIIRIGVSIILRAVLTRTQNEP